MPTRSMSVLVLAAVLSVASAASADTATEYVRVPAKFEAESYVAMSGVRTAAAKDTGGTDLVGWVHRGDWMDYAVYVPMGQYYSFEFRVASTKGGVAVVEQAGRKLATVTIPNTGGWQNWVTVKTGLPWLRWGRYFLTVRSETSGWNINWFTINAEGRTRPPKQPAAPPPKPALQPPKKQTCPTEPSGSKGSTGGASTAISKQTKYTTTKVRTAKKGLETYIVGSTYEGVVFAMDFDGKMRWENKLSGFMNHELMCESVTGDEDDEILVANADGSVYCLDSEGRLLWKTRPSTAPMNTVCVMHKPGGEPYVAAGGFDTNMYYLSGATGAIFETIASSTYSVQSPWGKGRRPPNKRHTANFLRRIRHKDGTETLVMHGVYHSMGASGTFYLFKPLATKPYKIIGSTAAVPKTLGDFRVADVDNDGTEEMLLGSSGMLPQSKVGVADVAGGQKGLHLNDLARKMDQFGYRVAQTEVVKIGQSTMYFTLFGSRVVLTPMDLDAKGSEVLASKYSYNDMWLDRSGNRMILASSQSGGNSIHILDLNTASWKGQYTGLTPPGNIQAILDNTDAIRNNLKSFKKPSWERAPSTRTTVWLMSESVTGNEALAKMINRDFQSPKFMTSKWFPKIEKNEDRESFSNAKYRTRRDGRKQYVLTTEEVLKSTVVPADSPGISYWGGHGNDPFYYKVSTSKAVIKAASDSGKKVVLIFPELEDHSKDFEFVRDTLLIPLADYSQPRNANLYLRNKHVFWSATVYTPLWSQLLSGDYADVMVPSMEETTDKSMELSLAARIGLWASGAVNNWGSRAVRDGTSFDRLRQFSHQMLPNPMLRMLVYHMANGATHLDNFPVNQNYMSVMWLLVAQGALFVPEPREVLSYSPVHLSMFEPNEDYMWDGNSVKWTTQYEDYSHVFSRLSGAWPGAPVKDYDFSKYAAGVSDRRLNYLPPYENGLVLITPPQSGAKAAKNPKRGMMANNLHPLYRNIMKEYYTDGKRYYTADGGGDGAEYSAEKFYETIKKDIEEAKTKLPVTVAGEVAWVVAQTASKHLRLTVIDGGYLNPSTKTATLTFHTVTPVRVRDVLDNTEFPVCDKVARVAIPTGSFRFIDIELDSDFYATSTTSTR